MMMISRLRSSCIFPDKFGDVVQRPAVLSKNGSNTLDGTRGAEMGGHEPELKEKTKTDTNCPMPE